MERVGGFWSTELKPKLGMVATITILLSACGGGGSGGSDGPDGEQVSSGFSVPSASGGDGLDKVISLLNVQDQSQVTHGVGGSISSTRSDLTTSVGCSSETSRTRSDFPEASSITNNQVCIETECATANSNSLMTTDTRTPDARRDTIFFFGGSVEVASNATAFDADAGRDQECDIDGATPEAQFPPTITGVYKGFIYQRDGDQLNRSEVVTLDCSGNECDVSGDALVNGNVTLEPEGTGAKFIWESMSIRLSSDEARTRFNAILSASPEGDV